MRKDAARILTKLAQTQVVNDPWRYVALRSEGGTNYYDSVSSPYGKEDTKRLEAVLDSRPGLTLEDAEREAGLVSPVRPFVSGIAGPAAGAGLALLGQHVNNTTHKIREANRTAVRNAQQALDTAKQNLETAKGAARNKGNQVPLGVVEAEQTARTNLANVPKVNNGVKWWQRGGVLSRGLQALGAGTTAWGLWDAIKNAPRAGSRFSPENKGLKSQGAGQPLKK